MPATLSPAATAEIESAILEAIRTLVRVMHAASELKPEAPVPKPLAHARLAATQILRFAAHLFPARRAPAEPPPAKAVTSPTPPTVCSRAAATPPMRTALNILGTAGAPASLRKTG